ncbi:hypothetical protein WG906_12255 [Pedobacter sp. P351]|uniref:hypothetical protein n=1 Tax=Pedobacter superstes TaxID=3133441 RepID=UPI0030AD551C
MCSSTKYPGFEYSSDQLSKFLAAGQIFTIKLLNNDIVHHEVEDPKLFKQWLLDHNIEDIRDYTLDLEHLRSKPEHLHLQ